LPARMVHVEPSYSHVSTNVVEPASKPPKRTTFPPTVTIRCPARACGPVTSRFVHVAPSHSHVSPSGWTRAYESLPPKRTILPPSVAIACPRRALGPMPLPRWAQLTPSHSHVSSRSALPE